MANSCERFLFILRVPKTLAKQDFLWLWIGFPSFLADCLIGLPHDTQTTKGAKSDWPFHNFRAFSSGDLRILCSSGTSCDGLGSSKVVKGSIEICTITEMLAKKDIILRKISGCRGL